MNNITKNIVSASVLIALISSLMCSCGKADTGNTTDTESNKLNDYNTEEQQNDLDTDSTTKAIQPAYSTAVEIALNNLLSDKILPDGSTAVFDEDYFMDDNSFAIYDYDGDSDNELIICWDGTSDENMFEAVYKYDENADTFSRIYYETLTRPEDTSDIKNRNGVLGADRYDDYYALTENNISLALRLLSGDLESDEVFDFSTPRNNHYLAEFHSDWPLHDADREIKEQRLGIDVSAYQGNVDFNKVKEAGYEFVIVRIGFRGYGSEGKMKADDKAVTNIKNAQAAGLDVGVYFFSQAVSEAEAVEEADFCFDILAEVGITDASQLDMPVVFDPESILHDDSRTDNVSGEQFTKNCIAFCNEVESRGFDSMIYANTTWEAYMLDLGKLHDYPIWYADYAQEVQSPYDYVMWQYSEKGEVPGIDGSVDLNIQYIY